MQQLYFDYLIPIHAVSSNYGYTPPSQSLHFEESKNFPSQQQFPELPGKIIEMSWCAYNLHDQVVSEERSYFIRPLNSVQLSIETVKKLRIDVNRINNEGISLVDAISLLNDYLYMKFIKKNLSFCLVCLDDDLLTRALPADALEANVKLQHCFHQYFNAEFEHQKYFPAVDSRKFYMNLELQGLTHCQTQCKYITNLILQLSEIGCSFTSPILIHFESQPIKTIYETYAGNSNGFNVPPKEGFNVPLKEEFNSEEDFKDSPKQHYIRLRGLPYKVRESEIIGFLRGVRVSKEDIALCYDYTGKFTGEAYVRLHYEHDFNKAIALHKSDLGKRFVDIYRANEADYLVAIESKSSSKKDSGLIIKKPSEQLDDTAGVIKLRGLPYSCTDQDIKEFFKGFNIRKDGVIRTMQGAKPSGESFVVFEDRSQIGKALGLNREKIGSRYVEIFQSSHKDLERYESQNTRGNGSSRLKERLPDLPAEKRSSALVMVGLPFSIKKSEIQDFFSEFGLEDSNIQLVADGSGRFSGRAVVTFESEKVAEKAKEQKNMKYIGDRYIELSEYS